MNVTVRQPKYRWLRLNDRIIATHFDWDADRFVYTICRGNKYKVYSERIIRDVQ